MGLLYGTGASELATALSMGKFTRGPKPSEFDLILDTRLQLGGTQLKWAVILIRSGLSR